MYTAVVLLLLIINVCDAATDNLTMAIDTDTSIYYDLRTNSVLPIESADSSRLPSHPTKFISRGLPCSCCNFKCSCCAGINITAIKFHRHICINVTVQPKEFALDFDLQMDDKQVFTNRLTARNPPPACVPLYFFPEITFCVRFFDLHVADDKFNACVDFETKVAQWPMFILHFNCVKVGGSGITWVRPPSHAVTPFIVNVTDPEVYDQVNFEFSDDDAYLHTSTLTPEKEDLIGNHKMYNDSLFT